MVLNVDIWKDAKESSITIVPLRTLNVIVLLQIEYSAGSGARVDYKAHLAWAGNDIVGSVSIDMDLASRMLEA